MKTIERDVTGAFILSSDEHILLGQSHKGGVYQNKWIVPGGGIEPGETAEQAMRREVLEETELEIPPDATIKHYLDDIHHGESRKIVGGEEVLVKMMFHDFVVHIPRPAAEIPIAPTEELERLEWIALAQITIDMVAPGTYYRLQKLGHTK